MFTLDLPAAIVLNWYSAGPISILRLSRGPCLWSLIVVSACGLRLSMGTRTITRGVLEVKTFAVLAVCLSGLPALSLLHNCSSSKGFEREKLWILPIFSLLNSSHLVTGQTPCYRTARRCTGVFSVFHSEQNKAFQSSHWLPRRPTLTCMLCALCRGRARRPLSLNMAGRGR